MKPYYVTFEVVQRFKEKNMNFPLNLCVHFLSKDCYTGGPNTKKFERYQRYIHY